MEPTFQDWELSPSPVPLLWSLLPTQMLALLPRAVHVRTRLCPAPLGARWTRSGALAPCGLCKAQGGWDFVFGADILSWETPCLFPFHLKPESLLSPFFIPVVLVTMAPL